MRTLTLALLVVFMALPAMAAPAITSEGAVSLKPRVEETLKAIATTFQKQGYTLHQQGTLTVEPAGTYYAITTPALSLTFGENVTRDIGMLAINAIPTDDPDVIKVAIALPTPIIDKTAAGKQVGILTLGKQNFSGLWHLEAQAFVQMAAAYQDVAYSSSIDGTTLKVPAATMNLQLTNVGNNLWSGTKDITAKNAQYKVDGTTYTVGNFVAKGTVDKLDLMARKNVVLAGPVKDKNAMMGQLMTQLADGSAMNATLNDIKIQGTETTNIQSATLQAAATGIQSEKMKGDVYLTLNGITSNAKDANFVPGNVVLKGQVENLPLKQVLQAKDGTQRRVAMAAAGTTIHIDNAKLDANAYGLDANGNFKSEGPLGMSGNLNMALRGVSELLRWLASPDAPQMNGKAMVPPQAIAVLTMVQMTGKPGNDVQGRPVLNYDFKMNADGTMTLNGADISALTQAFSASQAKQK